MRIKRLELRGFKSFVDPTALHLGPGIAAVVGPNGCGKSNVIDAIRWTLGEQSPSTLRGKAMADVIFAGSQGRPRANQAEVTIVFDNADGAFGGKHARYAEVEVTRRLERSGQSTYAINRQKCRLKDIVGLFVDTGVGARAYSIIEQGRVGFVISARPEERKLLIDEVAGVNRFKGQRTEAERRMKETRENLVRVADLEGEMERRRDVLAAQARKAEKFLELRTRWKQEAVTAAVLAGAELLGRQRERKKVYDGVAERQASEVASVENLGSRLTELREEADRARNELSSHRERRASLQATVRAAGEREKERAEEQASLAERLEVLQREHVDLQAATTSSAELLSEVSEAARISRENLGGVRAALDESQRKVTACQDAARGARASQEEAKQRQLEAMTAAARQRNSVTLLRRRLEDIAEERRREAEDLRGSDAEKAASERELDVARAALSAAVAARGEAMAGAERSGDGLTEARQRDAAAREQVGEKASRLAKSEAALAAERELVESLAGARPGLRALVEHLRGPGSETAAGQGFLGVVADLLVVPEGLEVAVELALGDRVDAAVFRNREALAAALAWVDAESPGRVVLLHLDTPLVRDGLATRVQGHPDAPDLPAQLLGGVQLVERLEELPLPDGTTAVHPPSARARSAAVLVRTADAQRGLLARRGRMRHLAEAVETDRAAHEKAQAELQRSKKAVEEAESEQARATAAVHEAQLVELGRTRDLESAERARQALRDEERRAEERRDRLRQTAERLAGELQRVGQELEATDGRRSALDAEIASLRDVVAEAEKTLAHATARSTQTQLELVTARHDAATAERDLRRLREELDQRQRRRQRIERDVAGARTRLARLAERSESSEEALAEARAELGAMELAEPGLNRSADEAAAAAALHQQSLATARATLGQTREELGRLGSEVGRLEARLEFAAQRATEQFQIGLVESAGKLLDEGQTEHRLSAGPGRPPLRVLVSSEDGPADVRASKAARLAREADALGAVNMAAAEEYAEIDGRYRELRAQREDLEEALADLRRAIRRIEQETRQRFAAAFDAVSRRFGALYPRLVGGGRAELTLTDPDDLMATGVEIRVEPPGKRLQNLQLLSGGEKAMAAIAFVFAIFEVKPSPFCLLDEVDAPLDEANSRRFNAMLSELSATTQFVVITHNRTTMEVADVLYGVTMQTPGVSSVVSVRVDAEDPAVRMRGPS